MNEVEPAIVDPAYIVRRVCQSDYPVSMTDVWGEEICDVSWSEAMDSDAGNVELSLSSEDREKVEAAYDAIVAFMQTLTDGYRPEN